ncbi:HIT family protein [Rhodococcus sp. NPDC003382]|uniref:HIT family protein n=1 Tax=unclassified Rhodococcus (in: high G+C Gram-positive bacteria) TaxID=192944 RepID=UPI0018CD9DDA|nr:MULTISPECIES: HIT family protein [unclassified Rhodococcus (in: high G+C Gram-positive bacteria)]MBH0123606.1 HIT family protein [Rhodococcus sp. CX]MCK8675493.1 HIT family protein [Rhodococcus sp. HM1]
MTSCVFCAIVAGEAPASVVLDEPDVIAFMDIRPFTAGHLLVVPKRHASGLAELDPEDGARIFDAGRRIAIALRSGDLPVDGVNLFLADGTAAGQEVFHVHLHVIPRRHGDGFGLRAVPRSPNRTVLDGTAAAIRDALSR